MSRAKERSTVYVVADGADRAGGSPVLRGTPVGAAADAMNEVSDERRRLLARADRAGGHERRRLRRQAEVAALREEHLRAAVEKL